MSRAQRRRPSSRSFASRHRGGGGHDRGGVVGGSKWSLEEPGAETERRPRIASEKPAVPGSPESPVGDARDGRRRKFRVAGCLGGTVPATARRPFHVRTWPNAHGLVGHGCSYDRLVVAADRSLERGKSAKADKLYAQALAARPDGVEALTGSAYVLLDRQRHFKAIETFRRALAIQPGFGPALFGIAESYRARGDSAQALGAYRQYLAIAPSGTDAPAARRQIKDLEAAGSASIPSERSAQETSPAAARSKGIREVAAARLSRITGLFLGAVSRLASLFKHIDHATALRPGRWKIVRTARFVLFRFPVGGGSAFGAGCGAQTALRGQAVVRRVDDAPGTGGANG